MPNVYTAKIVLRILQKANFIIVSQRGSHIKLKGLRHGKILKSFIKNQSLPQSQFFFWL